MPEPDFDQIARTLADALDEDFTMARASHIESKIAEQIRQVWNARGEADMRELAEPVSAIVDAIRGLDR